MSRAEEYRRIANDCREMPARMSLREDREHLLRMAAEYEKWAQQLEPEKDK